MTRADDHSINIHNMLSHISGVEYTCLRAPARLPTHLQLSYNLKSTGKYGINIHAHGAPSLNFDESAHELHEIRIRIPDITFTGNPKGTCGLYLQENTSRKQGSTALFCVAVPRSAPFCVQGLGTLPVTSTVGDGGVKVGE